MMPKELALAFFPVFLLLIAGEIFLFYRNNRRFPWLEAGISMLMVLIYGVVNAQSAAVIAPFLNFLYSLRLASIPVDTWWGLTLLFFGVEFFYYWRHRCAHEIRWIWANHSVHHSAVTVTLSGAYRLSLTEVLSGVFLFFVPLYFIGFDPNAVALMFGFNLLYQFWLHTEWIPKLGIFEWVFNTPSHHRAHHAINPEYINRNYGGVLIIFDRMFGTFVEEKTETPMVYGLIGKAPTSNILVIFFQEWLAMAHDLSKARNWRECLQYLFGRPGWTPNKSRQ
jgi:sterol desaturase/sphingolipid hydroxylase (fatty acid hydroxylase superfamily)